MLAVAACVPAPAPDPCDAEPTLVVGDTRLTFEVPGCATLDLVARPLGEGDLHVTLELIDGAVRPILTAGPGGGAAEGVLLEGAWTLHGDTEPVWWRQGYQSWSFAGVVPLAPIPRDADDLPQGGGDGDAFSILDETSPVSWWAGLLGRDDGASVLLGALTAEVVKVRVAADADAVAVVWGGRGERRTLDALASWSLDRLWVGAASDPWALWTRYADEVSTATGTPPPAAAPPVGWATWYQHYTAIDEATVRANLALGRSLDWGTDAPVFQIDDGWQVSWGAWEADATFPSGMAGVAAAITDAGFVPGLWMAPFYVDRGTETWLTHRDWWVRDPEGGEIRFTNLGSGDYAVLDVTHPDAAAWLSAQIAGRVADGYPYLKLDFLYAGAQEGQRRVPVTGLEAYRIGLDLLREAAGPDTWILACGAPLLPTVGFADSFRSGADIAFEVTPDPDPAYVRWQARQTAGRGWANGRWWWNDPDQILVRPPLTDAQARGAVVANVLSGGAWFLGDDLVALSDARRTLALHPDAVATRGAATRPEHPLRAISGFDASPLAERVTPDDVAPTRWRIGDHHVALYNGGEGRISVMSPAGVDVLTRERFASDAPVHLAPGDGRLIRLGP